MTSRILRLRAPLAPLLAALMLACPAAAQQVTPVYPALSEVDPVEALSRYLRMLAANPRDLASLTGAGRSALAVGDANAALGFYARAEELAPRNGRIKAGLASALVQMEQPRTALKLFDEAVALGVPVGEISADRGLAHDLVGDNRAAQMDYTLALRANDDDETLRRLALSMAISGDRAGALTMLDPLLRKNDGGAVRARAFILALTGDQAGATKVVQAAMPGAQATVMANFLSRLKTLNPAQKALAVNFGYFPSDGRSYSAAELFADARAARPAVPATNAGAALIPSGPALGRRPADMDVDADAAGSPAKTLARAEVPPPAHVLAAPVPGHAAPVPARPATPLASNVATAGGASPAIARAPAAPPATAMTATPATPLDVARGSTSSTFPPSPVATDRSMQTSPAPPAYTGVIRPPVASASTALPANAAAATASAPPVASAVGQAASGTLIVSATAPALAYGTTAAPPAAAEQPLSPLAAVPDGAAAIATVDLPASNMAEPSRAEVPAPPPTRLAALAPPSARVAPAVPKPSEPEKANLAASRPVPKADVKATPGAKPEAAKPGASKADAKLAPATKAAADSKSKSEPKAGETKAADAKTKADPKAKAGADVRTSGKDAKDAKVAGKDPKAAGKDGRAATATADKGKAEAKAAPEAKAKGSERYWVQVASGSNKDNLDKAWTNVKAKAPALLNGRSTYTAPWRASNRLLIGPFKSEDEAQAEVNKLAKAGVGGIQFTSRAGVDVDKVTAR